MAEKTVVVVKKEGGLKMYVPKPIDTSDVKLSDELVNLTEILARNVHDTWAVARISEGWTYGTERNQGEKTTPCLVEYDQLPESEKDYDRRSAMESVKLILKLGYKITKEESKGISQQCMLGYSQKDREKAIKLKEFLVKNGIEVWLAPDNIPVGRDYSKVIVDTIKESSVYILLLSQNVLSSGYVLRELDRACYYHKRVVPICLDGIAIEDDMNLSFYLSGYQIISYDDFMKYNLLKIQDILC